MTSEIYYHLLSNAVRLGERVRVSLDLHALADSLDAAAIAVLSDDLREAVVLFERAHTIRTTAWLLLADKTPTTTTTERAA